MPGRPTVPRVRTCVKTNLRLHNSAHSTSAVTKVLRGDDLGPIVQDAHHSLRVREDGGTLPLPPALDPLVVERHTRWKQQKAQPDVAHFTPFQKRLSENPYAHALASPVRIERPLHVGLPTALLLTLHPKPHPETGDPWLLPLTLSTPKSTPKPVGSPTRFLAHKHTVRHLTAKKDALRRALSARTESPARIVWRSDMPDFLQTLLARRVVDKLRWWFNWRGRLTPVVSPAPDAIATIDDAACVLLYGSLETPAHALQERVAALVAEADKWSLYFRAGFGEHFDPHVQRTGEDGTPQKATHHPPMWWEPVTPRLAPRAQFPPLEFPTTTWRGARRPVYSLTDLLGAERAAELVGGTPADGQRCWVMRRGRQAVAVEMLLLQLQSYLAEPAPLWEPRDLPPTIEPDNQGFPPVRRVLFLPKERQTDETDDKVRQAAPPFRRLHLHGQNQ